jgi:organic hydroperoxide reductase OsmC/OhrA
MGPEHHYAVTVEWTGNTGTGTSDYRSYSRDNLVTADGPPPLDGSADRAFRGDPSRWNPEQLFLAAASQCHMLAYLHQAAINGVVVVGYVDHPTGTMREDGADGGSFNEIALHPEVTITADSDVALAERLHHNANRTCFIAASLNVPVLHEVHTVVAA